MASVYNEYALKSQYDTSIYLQVKYAKLERKKNHKWITFLLSPEIVWTSSKSCLCKEFKLSCPYNAEQTTILFCSSYAFFSCILVNNLIRSSLCPHACPCLKTLSLILYKKEKCINGNITLVTMSLKSN